MRIEGEKIYLKPFIKSYAPHWVRWTQDEDVTRYSVLRPYTMEEEIEYIERQKSNELIFSIFLKANDKIIGNCGIHKSKNEAFPHNTFVGLVIGEKDEWGMGYGTKAMRTLLKYIRDERHEKEVYLNVDTLNIAVQKCYQKCGFEIVEKQKVPERINSNGEQYVMWVDLQKINF